MIRAIYEKGVFRPVDPVNFPDRAEVELDARLVEPAETRAAQEAAHRKIVEIMSRRYNSGHADTAARHNEHQP